MRRTLSQPSPASARDGRRHVVHPSTTSRRGISSGARAFVVAALAGLSFACGDAASNEVDGRIDASARAEAAATEEPFAWPVDPSHPVLEIEIESSASNGRILIELMPELAPATVVQVIELANEGFYDQTTFHRVIPGFMIQGGDPNSRDRDPTNDGRGPTGRPLHDEFGETPFVRGVVGMGNKGRQDSTSTQFFIMHDDNQELNGRYTAVGRVLAGMEVVDDITRVPIDRIGRTARR